MLKFRYKSLASRGTSVATECVLSGIDLALSDGGLQPQVEYTYERPDGGAEQAGRLAQVQWPQTGRTEQYTYANGAAYAFKETVSGGSVVQHLFDSSGRVTSDIDTHGTSAAIWAQSQSCPANTCCVNPSAALFVNTSVTAGDGAGSTLTATRRVESMVASFATSPRVSAVVDVCDGGECKGMSAGTTSYQWTCGSTSATPSAVQDKRGNWTVYKYQPADAGSVPAGLSLAPELQSVLWGATDSDGGGAVLLASYGYDYGDTGQSPRGYPQLKTVETRASVLNSGDTTKRTFYDTATNRVIKSTHRGWTMINGSASEKVYATFFFNTRTCVSTASADPLGRTLEVHGPCEVSAESATDCTGTYPVTGYEYWSSSETSSRKNRLRKVSRLPGGSADCATSSRWLVTEHTDYDALGNVTRTLDENGDEILRTWAGKLLTSETFSAASATTTYVWDNDKLTRVIFPEGNSEYYCYRTDSSGNQIMPCSGGIWTPRLQWRAKGECSGSTCGWSSLSTYEYSADGMQSKETLRGCTTSSSCTGLTGGEIRQVKKSAFDAHQRPTWSGMGDATGQYSSTSFFDRNNNLAGIGVPYNSSTAAFCGGPRSGSPDLPANSSYLCSELAHDQADRVLSLDQFPAGTSTGERTCFAYDGHSNVTRVAPGNSTSTTCSSVSGAATSDYQFDDFGRVVKEQLPWTSDGSGNRGGVWFEYDAMGNQVLKKTSAMNQAGEWVTYRFDQLGRELEANRRSSSVDAGLYVLDYDESQTPGGSCPSLTRGKGHLRRRTDSFGYTWYSYNAQGRVTMEMRQRNQQSCSGGTDYSMPHTEYTWTKNGNLSQVVYPLGRSAASGGYHGRTVAYIYGDAGYTDLVTAMQVSTLSATTWSNNSIIQNVQWEPGGGLRSYEVTPPAGSSYNFKVEYLHGDNAESDPGTGVPSSGSDDHTGRLRGLWVSTGTSSTTGDILKKRYKWKGDQVARINTALLGESTPRQVDYGYDSVGRLSTVDGGYPNGPTAYRAYGFDARGNRTTEKEKPSTFITTSTFNNYDRLASVSRSDDSYTRTYTQDRDGRPTSEVFYSNGSYQSSMEFSQTSGQDSVLKGAGVGGAWYNYFYDPFLRRWAKQYPTGIVDEYYYDLGHQMYQDMGNWTLDSSVVQPIDEYLWLGGRPVAMIRGLLANQVRHRDVEFDCGKNADPANCGFYFIVTDHIGMPVLQLDYHRQLTGANDYDAFGYPNRGALHGSAISPSPGTYYFYFDVAANNTVNDVRARFSMVDTGAGGTFSVASSSGSSATMSGQLTAPHWTRWLQNTVQSNWAKLVTTTSGPNGGQAEAFEYRRYQSGAVPLFTPLRFPGQYHDVETDLFENWHRYLDPYLNRYLAPEPMLQSPLGQWAFAYGGWSLPAYSYALNNPARWVDRNGLAPDDSPVWDRWNEATRTMSGEEKLAAGTIVLAGAVMGTGLAILADVVPAAVAVPLTAVGPKVAEVANRCENSPIGGVITGFTRHGINQAISRNGYGVNPQAILEAVRNGVPQLQANGTTQYVGQTATVVVNAAGQVVTVIARTTTAMSMGGGTLVR